MVTVVAGDNGPSGKPDEHTVLMFILRSRLSIFTLAANLVLAILGRRICMKSFAGVWDGVLSYFLFFSSILV